MKAFLQSIWRSLRHGDRLSNESLEEMQFHLDMETERLIEQGLNPSEARRQAHLRFGGMQKYREETREARRLAWVDPLARDVRFGVRMLIKYRWLSLMSIFAIALAIAIGTCGFEVLGEMLNPALPHAGGERVVALGIPGDAAFDPSEHASSLTHLEEIGASRTVFRNVATDATSPEPMKVAELTASTFRIVGVRPIIGRHLLAEDEQEGALPVLLIREQIWRSRFGSDPGIVERTVTLDGVPHRVAGVMPAGFGFPYDHDLWVALPATALSTKPEHLSFFARLAPGSTPEDAREQLAPLVAASRAAHGAQKRGEQVVTVVPYTRAQVDLSHPSAVRITRAAKFLVGALVFLVAVNVAVLIYARTVTRIGEITVRSALGASRQRLLSQLFIEALMITLLGVGAGLGLVVIIFDRLRDLGAPGGVPYWIRFDLSASAVVYAFALAVIAALIMGIAPGMKATGRSLYTGMAELSARGGQRLGPVWTALIVAQVGVAVAILPIAVHLSFTMANPVTTGSGVSPREIVVAVVSHGSGSTEGSELRDRQLELLERLQREEGIADVTFSNSVPGFSGGGQIEIEGPAGSHRVVGESNTLWIDPKLTGTYEARVLRGRALTDADASAPGAVIVNRTFARRYLGDVPSLGARFRYAAESSAEPGPWYEIVGFVEDFPAVAAQPFSDGSPYVYHATGPGTFDLFVLSLRFRGAIPPDLAASVRRAAALVDPSLQIRRVVSLSDYHQEVQTFWRHLTVATVLLTLSVLLLSAAGIYALMSFTVAQRTREIGIRSALGAPRVRLFFGIFGKAARQLLIGLLAGSAVSALLLAALDFSAGTSLALLAAVALIMLMIGLVAAAGPARSGIEIEVMEALRT